MKKVLIAVLTTLAAACICIPAAAGTFTTQDGVLSLELPNENWTEIADPQNWVALSDGGNVVTIEHFSNGEDLPKPQVATDHYVNVLEALYSTQNEVFIITGSLVDAAKLQEMTGILASVKVLKYDTKLAVKKEDESETNAAEYTVTDAARTMYVTSNGLNVRSGCSTDYDIVGGYPYGASVQVLGDVQQNGQDTGWRQVNYEGTKAYVAGNFLSDTAPAPKQSSSGSSNSSSGSSNNSNSAYFTGAVKTVYEEDGTCYSIYQCSDGFWYDSNGTPFQDLGNGIFGVYEGNKRVTTDYIAPQSDDSYDYPTSVSVHDEVGESYTLTLSGDGMWYDQYGEPYIATGDEGVFRAYEGNKYVMMD